VCSFAGHVQQVVLALNLAGWWTNHKIIFPILYEVFLFVMAPSGASHVVSADRKRL